MSKIYIILSIIGRVRNSTEKHELRISRRNPLIFMADLDYNKRIKIDPYRSVVTYRVLANSMPITVFLL